MKKIFRNLKFGLLLCAGAFAASCSDVEDAMNEIPYTRVLTPLNFEAKVDASVGTDINFSWSAVSNADSYILELFEAVPTTSEEGEEVFTMPEDFDALTPYDQIEVAKDAVPYTVKNLTVDMSFWARVRGVSGKMDASHWAYLTEEVTTSAVRKGLNPAIAERTSSSVTVQWDDADDKDDLTSVRCELVVPVEGATPINTTLSEEDKTACKVMIENLDPCTNYKFTLLFGKSGSRGVITAYTRPDTEGATEIDSQEKLIAALQGASGDLKLQLAYNDGVLYDLSSLMTINAKENIYDPFEFPYGLEIYGQSNASGAKPVIKFALKSMPGATKLHFEDVTIDGGNQCGVFVTTGTTGDENAGTLQGVTLENAEFVNCEITGFTKGIWSGSTGCNVTGTLLYENIYAHDINPVGAGGGDFIDVRGGDYGAIVVKNSTFYAAARTFLRVSETATKEVGKIEVANCTFNQVTVTNSSSNNSGIFHIRYTETSKPSDFLKLGSFTMTKCVFMNMNNANETESSYWVRLTRDSNENLAPKCEGNVYYNIGHLYESKNGGQNTFFPTKSLQDGEPFTTAMALAEGGMILEDDPCVNSIAGKMYLKNGSNIAANRAGDPRWWNASMPEVVRATELETVTEATTWDFTDKTKFDSEDIEENTIIENIRIYAPAKVVMSEGVTFSSAATVNNKGIPTGSALAFKADGYGSVEVTAQGTGITSTVQIIAGSDAYSVNADGKTHKVVFGDLVGANEIYILPSVANITFTQIAWSKDVEAEVTTTPLATPKVTFDATSLDQGTEQAVTASWDAVAGAASYEVTFDNKKQPETAETTFVLDAAAVKALAVGEYKISVIAKPTETSTKYTASEAGEASFKIKKVVVGVEKTVTWDFTQFDGTNLTGETWSGAAFGADVVWNVNAACPLTIMNGVQCDGNQAKMQNGSSFSNGSTPDKRALYFVAPGPGILTIVHKSANSSDATRKSFVSVNGKVTETTPSPTTEWGSVEVDLSDIEAGQTVYVFANSNNFQSVSYKYTATPQTYTYDWDFTTITDLSGTLTEDKTITANDRVLNLLSTGSNLTVEAGKQIKTGGSTKVTDNIPVGRAFSFVAQGPGTLYVNLNTASSGKNDRPWWVCVNDTTHKIFESETCPTEYTVVTVDGSDVEAGQTVYVGVGGGINFKGIKWVEER